MTLENRFENFMLSLPSVEGIDSIVLDHKDRQFKKADYLAMGRKLVVEQKCINQEQASKIQLEIDKYSKDENYPIFYGKRDFNLIIDKLPNKNEIKQKVFSNITNLLEDYLRQANKQIESTRQLFENYEAYGLLVILNEKVKVLSPEIVSTRIQQRLKERRDGKPRFNNINYVIFISETHLFKGLPSVIVIKGVGASSASQNISDYIDYLVNSWAQFNGGGCFKIDDVEGYFKHIEEKLELSPKTVSRSEARAIWYSKNRYMKDWSDVQVAQTAAKFIDQIQPYVMKGGPKLPTAKLAEMMLEFGDFIEESNIRGLDLRELKKNHGN